VIGAFDVLLVDAPWYVNYIKAWLAGAISAASANGAIVVLSLFPELTRPSAVVERQELFGFFNTIGRTRILADQATYETPMFEMEVLSWQRLPAMCAWRRGDLIEIQIEGGTPRPSVTLPREDPWARYRIGSTTVALRRRTLTGAVRASPPYSDGSFLLRSVSARDPIRRRCDLITSRNWGLTISGARRVGQLLGMLSEGVDPISAIGRVARNGDEEQALELVVAVVTH
jgi:hypothetical protein